MDLTQRGIILLLKSAVTQTPQTLPEGFDMEAALPMIHRHHMAALCYDGAARCGVPQQHPVMQQLLWEYCQLLVGSEGQMKQLQRVFAAFEANGIEYMPLKGSVLKALYPVPEMRTMGDADVLIRLEQYERIVPIMESLGFIAAQESDHELIWRHPGLILELHKRLIPSYNKDFYAYFGDGWQLARQRQGSRWSMTAEDQYIYLFTHFSKHYRDGGIGCRHVTDLWVYRRCHPDMDEAYVERELERLQLARFHSHVRRMLDVWFREEPEDDRTTVLSSCIFASGSWGSREDSVLSDIIKHSKHSPLGFNGRLVYLCRLAFPPLAAMRENYPALRRAPWLLPGAWLVRLVDRLLFQRWKLKRHRKNLSALNKENLDRRRRMLLYLGLDYNF